MRSKTIFVLAVVAVFLPASAFAQANRGGLYAFKTARLGDCPGLDWHVNVERSGEITGVVAWEGRMANVEGTMQQNGKFRLTAHEVASGRTATVIGSSAGDHLTLTMNGTGGPCDGKTVQVGRPTGGGSG
jgi:hypothetical protein